MIMKDIHLGKPVKGENLIGRESEIKSILQLIELGQSVVIIAPRRFGKTSLILEILHRLKKENKYIAFIDVFTTPDLLSLSKKITEQVLENNQLGKTFRSIKDNLTSLIKNIELKQTIENFEFILKYATQIQDKWELFSESIDFIEAYPKKHNNRMVCAFDEFGDLNKFNGDSLVKLIRSKIQLHENAVYLFSGSYESVMDSLFVNPKSPFYRFARIINLGYINTSEFKKYIVKTLEQNKISVVSSLIDELLNFTKGHPYYTQLLLQQIQFNSKDKDSLKNQTIEILLDQALSIENNFLEKQWEEISKSRELVQTLLAVVQQEKQLYSVVDTKKVNLGRALKKLSGRGLLYYKEGRYHQTDPLFELWIKKNVII
jgi:AAA+ ATPase superfamily predicted ATPase